MLHEHEQLLVRNLFYSYHTMDGETPALCDISFSVHAGEFLAIVGPSGCGKSTLLSLLAGLLVPQSGEIRHDPKHCIGYMLQRDHLFEWRTILENVSLGLEIQHRLDEHSLRELMLMLSDYGLQGFENAHPSELSGGMRQRAALIRTLALKPDLLLLDEPFSALDYQTRINVCDDISHIIRDTKKTAVLITHDLAEAVSVADRILVLSARPGTLVAELQITFSPEADSSLKRRNTPEFPVYFNQLWTLMQKTGS